MYAIYNGHSLIAFSQTGSNVPELLEKVVGHYTDVFLRAIENPNSWMRTQFGTDPEAYVSQSLGSVKVYYTEEEASHLLNFNPYGNQSPEGWEDVSNDFVEYVLKDVVVGQSLTATITKKGLKSTGKKVNVVSEVGGSELTEASQIKELLDQLTRVNVYCPGWGKMSVSPDSLGDIAVTPKTRQTRTFVIKLEELP